MAEPGPAAAPRGPSPDGAVLAPPVELYLEVTNRCNLRCRACPQHFGMAEPAADLHPDQVRQLLDTIPRLERAVLHGLGEPLLNPHLATIVGLVKDRGAHALLNSNGTLLTEARVAPLVAAGLDEIRVSVDAATSATYARVRGARALDEVLANLASVAALAAPAGRSSPRLSLWMIGLRETIDELPALVRVAAAAGVREVYLQRLVTSERGLARRDQALDGLDGPHHETIAAAEALATELGVALFGSGATTAGASVERASPVRERPWRRCTRPWSLMYVTANGKALPCCIAPFTDTPYDQLVLGDAFQQPLDRIWTGPAYRRWRARMLAGEPPPPCRRCGIDWSL